MKALVRSAPAQATLAFLLAAYLGVALKTIRWDWQGRELAEAIWASGGPSASAACRAAPGFRP